MYIKFELLAIIIHEDAQGNAKCRNWGGLRWLGVSQGHRQQAEEIAVENGRISNFEGLVTLTLDRVILHTVVHHPSTSTYMPNFTEVEETFCGRTDVHARTYVRWNGRTSETSFILSWLCRRVNLTWPRPFQRRFVICRLGIRCSTHTPNLKCLRLPAKATPNVRILVFSHPLGDLGVTHRVHLWLDESALSTSY